MLNKRHNTATAYAFSTADIWRPPIGSGSGRQLHKTTRNPII